MRTGQLVSPAQIWIKDGRIQAGGLPADADVLDLGNRTLLPGLIDCHTHLLIPAAVGELGYLKLSNGDLILAGVVNARKVLQAGFTTIRDVGASADFGDLALRDAIARGDVPGPRMLAAGPALSITGGHGDLNGFPPPRARAEDEPGGFARRGASHGARVAQARRGCHQAPRHRWRALQP